MILCVVDAQAGQLSDRVDNALAELSTWEQKHSEQLVSGTGQAGLLLTTAGNYELLHHGAGNPILGGCHSESTCWNSFLLQAVNNSISAAAALATSLTGASHTAQALNVGTQSLSIRSTDPPGPAALPVVIIGVVTDVHDYVQ